MKNYGALELAMWSTAIALLVWAVLRLATWTPATVGQGHAVAGEVARRGASSSLINAAAEVTVNRNPFRIDRRPADVAFGMIYTGAAAAGQDVQPVISHPRPLLVLAGIIGGPPWLALVEGLPGLSGSLLVQAGEVIGDLRIRGVGPDAVSIQGPDTTWNLPLKKSMP